MLVAVKLSISDKENTEKKLSDAIVYDSENATDSLEKFLKKIETGVKDNINKFENIIK